MDCDPDGPDAELQELMQYFGHRYDVYAPGPGARCWLAYDRRRLDRPAITAETGGELWDRLALLTPWVLPPSQLA